MHEKPNGIETMVFVSICVTGRVVKSGAAVAPGGVEHNRCLDSVYCWLTRCTGLLGVLAYSVYYCLREFRLWLM